MTLQEEITRRRTFAVIAHPDAGKTTLTENCCSSAAPSTSRERSKAIKSRREPPPTSWRSNVSAVFRSLRPSWASNTRPQDQHSRYPGPRRLRRRYLPHADGGDSVIIVIDGAKGVESQTRKLMDVCRMRQTPVIVFVNKLDRPCKDPFDLLDESRRNSASGYVPSHSRFRAATPSRAFTTSTRRTSRSLRATNGRRPTLRP